MSPARLVLSLAFLKCSLKALIHKIGLVYDILDVARTHCRRAGPQDACLHPPLCSCSHVSPDLNQQDDNFCHFLFCTNVILFFLVSSIDDLKP